ncbi:glycine betaine ABC transporter substrate-binding protein [Brachybacterium alimentarium]|uniref:glycine betaine ABC transporter substrate-binding protein n=1 Tax=Brachybacterium alimentarium TaxID=47845 RepID=UPI000DF1F057|nr:glycine betaine ABC transporter substrate-binding protein [Brachybacterium alimentarium]RCS62432.1 glycine/betaine ABC transporter substrate-binding protein [Brachybacterium alimentarium]RCS75511.1 glycine/betaine ABC transporter substrate-binding protein [Brachybacterium alimentarium]RCS79252.1 glycine/betaine ABC transporter substrate-binding protein [Brachybacterium alimentarium]
MPGTPRDITSTTTGTRRTAGTGGTVGARGTTGTGGRRSRLGRREFGALAGLALLPLAGCGLRPATAYVPEVAPGSITPIDGLPAGASITVTGKNFTEQLILGKIGVIAATAAGFDVVDLTNVPGSVPARELMTSGEADMSWEYTGTAWLTYMGQTEGIPDQTEQWEAVRDMDEPAGLTWLEPAPLNNTYALAVRSDAVDELGGISTLSELADLPIEERTLCVEAEFNSRADGLIPLLETYGIPRDDPDGVPEDNISIYDTGAVYTATARGSCNFGEVFTTDGRIESLDLTVLEDDLGYFPAYNVAAILNTSTLETYPELADVYDQVTPVLTDDALRTLNLRVDENGELPADVAFEFMVEQGFVTKP